MAMRVSGSARHRLAWSVFALAAFGLGVVVGFERPAAAACALTSDVDAVAFTGVVSAVVVPESGADDGAIATFAVEQWHEGGGPSEVAVIVNSASDGAEFVSMGDERPVTLAGERWRMVVRDAGHGTYESACTPSARLAAAPSPTGIAASPGSPSTRIGVVVVAVVVAMAIVAVLGRRRGRAGRHEPAG